MARRPSKHTRPFRELRVTATGEQRPGGGDGRWVVRTMSGAAAIKSYRCPGCHQNIAAGVAHLVVWPSEPPIGASQSIPERRHWHTACWRSGRSGAMTPRLNVLTYGDAGTAGDQRIVLCHGLFGQGRNWSTLGRSLADDGWYVALPDLPDHGRSEWTEEVDYRAMGDAVAAELGQLAPEVTGSAGWAVVGHSMGGKVAMRLALDHRDLVDRLCVVDIAPVHQDPLSAFSTYVRAMRLIDLSRISDRAGADAVLTEHGVADPVVRSFLLQNLRRSTSGSPPWRWQMNLDLLGAQLDRLGGWPQTEQPPYLGPVLWIAGAESDYVRPEHSPAMRALFPQTQLVTIKHAGHWVHSEQPEVFASVLRRFLIG